MKGNRPHVEYIHVICKKKYLEKKSHESVTCMYEHVLVLMVDRLNMIRMGLIANVLAVSGGTPTSWHTMGSIPENPSTVRHGNGKWKNCINRSSGKVNENISASYNVEIGYSFQKNLTPLLWTFCYCIFYFPLTVKKYPNTL